MKTYIIYLVSLGSIFLLTGWTKESSVPQCCKGSVTSKEKTDELYDIRIGGSESNSDNKNIIVYRKPETQATELNELKFDLDCISKIKSSGKITRFKDSDYVEITLFNHDAENETSIECIIPKDKKVWGKLKTGWSASYLFGTLSELTIDCCPVVEREKKLCSGI